LSICRHTVPCVVFAFNRPDKLKRILDALRIQEIDRLIIFVDGPRDKSDIELVERCRAIAKNIDWVDKEFHFGEQNHGLPGLTDNISKVMNEYKSAIFVEDDCLPMPGFYYFMRRTLSYYEQEKRVFSIGGYQPIEYKYFKNYPYSIVSSARFLCWGWATWQDRWEMITPYLSRYWELYDGLSNVPDIAGHDLSKMAQDCAEGRLESWAIKIAISTLWLDRIHLLPTRGLVRNIGHDGSGTHGAVLEHNKSLPKKNIYEHSLDKIVWLENLEVNKDYAEKLKQFVRSCGSSSENRFLDMVYAKLRHRVPRVIKNWVHTH